MGDVPDPLPLVAPTLAPHHCPALAAMPIISAALPPALAPSADRADPVPALPPTVPSRLQARLSALGHGAASSTCLAEMRALSPPRGSCSDDALLRHSAGAVPIGGGDRGGAGELGNEAEGGGVVMVGNGVVVDVERLKAAQYDAWMLKHPSALASFDRLAALMEGRQVAVFLDYDGTLSPIVDDPDKAYMSSAMRAAVRGVAAHFPAAIISGRGREKVLSFVQLPELYYAGSHGMDIMLPARKGGEANAEGEGEGNAEENGVGGGGDGGKGKGGGSKGVHVQGAQSVDEKGHHVVLFQPASRFAGLMSQVCNELRERLKGVQGAHVENNKFCVSVHFRRVPEELWEQQAEVVTQLVAQHPELRTSHGRKVLEIRPVVDWDKGKAVAYLLTTLGLSGDDSVLPVYIGDDRTDEDAFKMLQERGSGCGIIVSAAPKPSAATFSLRDPSEVKQSRPCREGWEVVGSGQRWWGGAGGAGAELRGVERGGGMWGHFLSLISLLAPLSFLSLLSLDSPLSNSLPPSLLSFLSIASVLFLLSPAPSAPSPPLPPLPTRPPLPLVPAVAPARYLQIRTLLNSFPLLAIPSRSSSLRRRAGKVDWINKRSFLVKNKVVGVPPAEAARLAKEEGHVIIDVRTVAEYNEVHPEGAVGVEFYRLIKEWTPYHVLRRAAFAFFGVLNGTEENPEFLKQVEAAVPDKETPIILACMPGGTLKPTQNFPYGKESRSLNAANVLVKNGYKNVRHIEGGVNFSDSRSDLHGSSLQGSRRQGLVPPRLPHRCVATLAPARGAAAAADAAKPANASAGISTAKSANATAKNATAAGKATAGNATAGRGNEPLAATAKLSKNAGVGKATSCEYYSNYSSNAYFGMGLTATLSPDTWYKRCGACYLVQCANDTKRCRGDKAAVTVRVVGEGKAAKQLSLSRVACGKIVKGDAASPVNITYKRTSCVSTAGSAVRVRRDATADKFKIQLVGLAGPGTLSQVELSADGSKWVNLTRDSSKAVWVAGADAKQVVGAKKAMSVRLTAPHTLEKITLSTVTPANWKAAGLYSSKAQAERYRQRCEASLGELVKRQVVLVDEGVEAVISEPAVVGLQGDLPLSSTPEGEEDEKSAEIQTRRRAQVEEVGGRDEPECALKEQATLSVEDGELPVAHSSPVPSNTPTNVATHCATVPSDDDDALLQAALAIPPPARHQLPRTPLPQATVPAGDAADPCPAVAVDKVVEGDMTVRLDLDSETGPGLTNVQEDRSARIQQDEVDARVLAVGGGQQSAEERCRDADPPGAGEWRRVAREAAEKRRLAEEELRRAEAVAEDVRKENEKLRDMLRCFEHTVVDESGRALLRQILDALRHHGDASPPPATCAAPPPAPSACEPAEAVPLPSPAPPTAAELVAATVASLDNHPASAEEAEGDCTDAMRGWTQGNGQEGAFISAPSPCASPLPAVPRNSITHWPNVVMGSEVGGGADGMGACGEERLEEQSADGGKGREESSADGGRGREQSSAGGGSGVDLQDMIQRLRARSLRALTQAQAERRAEEEGARAAPTRDAGEGDAEGEGLVNDASAAAGGGGGGGGGGGDDDDGSHAAANAAGPDAAAAGTRNGRSRSRNTGMSESGMNEREGLVDCGRAVAARKGRKRAGESQGRSYESGRVTRSKTRKSAGQGHGEEEEREGGDGCSEDALAPATDGKQVFLTPPLVPIEGGDEKQGSAGEDCEDAAVLGSTKCVETTRASPACSQVASALGLTRAPMVVEVSHTAGESARGRAGSAAAASQQTRSTSLSAAKCLVALGTHSPVLTTFFQRA
ncbi:unnamed protein product [Closterium sp. Naga37s-1]|nr:unnamed protein product [Closterium sp. Naga37s-1]